MPIVKQITYDINSLVGIKLSKHVVKLSLTFH